MDKPKNIQENQNKCICPICSLYASRNRKKQEKFFCDIQKSEYFIDSNKNCACSICPIFHKNHLANGYFCVHETEQ